MSDTKLQLNNRVNRELINRLKRLYRQEKSLLREIRFINNMIKDNYTVYIGNYEINWSLKVAKDKYIVNQDMINIIRSKLIIC